MAAIFLIVSLLLAGCQMPGYTSGTRPNDGSASKDNSAPSSPVQPEEPPAPPVGGRPAEELPASALLAVQNIAQNPELPNGCEATSLTMVLNHLGAEADKLDIAYNWIPSQAFDYSGDVKSGGDPALVYAGNPAEDGYYCFDVPVAEAANLYMQANDMPYTAYDITGAAEEQLAAFLADGYPVIVWTTVDNGEPYALDSNAWLLSDSDEWYVPYSNLHVMVLRGYDEENFYFADPLEQYPALPRDEFMLHYTQMGSRAVVIY